jgi:hypothetical protein
MLKAADALYGAGYGVHVISAAHTPWAVRADEAVRTSRSWSWTVIDYSRSTARLRHVKTGLRRRVARAIVRAAGPARVPIGVSMRAHGRAHDELVSAIATRQTDFVYGGTAGALMAIAEGAQRLGVPYGLDLEDFHSAEQEGPGSDEGHELAEQIERAVLPRASVLTAGSPMIADAYAEKYGLRPRPIHNTFSLQFPAEGSGMNGTRLKLYWFSQTLGPGRGLEDVVLAVGRSRIAAELHVRARATPVYLGELTRLARDAAPSLSLLVHEPASPDSMVRLSQGYDLGVSGEEPSVLNRRLCLGNKIFTYLAAGVPVLMTSTPAQERLGRDLGQAAIVYESGDIVALAERLQWLASNSSARCVTRNAAKAAAERRWHWEHPDDRGALLDAVGAVVPSR